MSFISARNAAGLKHTANITATHEVLERGMEYLYEKKIVLMAQAIIKAEPDTDTLRARERAERFTREHYVRPWKTMCSATGNAGQDTWAMEQEHLPELMRYIQNERHFKSANNSVFLKQHGIGSYPHLVDAALAQLHREQVEIWTQKLGSVIDARYYVDEHVCRCLPAIHNQMVWHVHEDSVALLRELIKRPCPWIKSNQREKLVAHGITPKKEVLHRVLPEYFERLVDQQMADYEIETGREISRNEAQQQVEATKLRKTDALRFSGDGWEIHEHFILQLARDLPEIRAKGKQDWVSLSETGHVILRVFPEIKTMAMPNKFEWLQEQAGAFFEKKVKQVKRSLKIGDDDAIGEVERAFLFKDDSHSHTIWLIRKEVVPEFRGFVLENLCQATAAISPDNFQVVTVTQGRG